MTTRWRVKDVSEAADQLGELREAGLSGVVLYFGEDTAAMEAFASDAAPALRD